MLDLSYTTYTYTASKVVECEVNLKYVKLNIIAFKTDTTDVVLRCPTCHKYSLSLSKCFGTLDNMYYCSNDPVVDGRGRVDYYLWIKE